MNMLRTDIAIIGAGSQALTLVTHLLQKSKRRRDRLNVGFSPGFEVFDPSGTYLAIGNDSLLCSRTIPPPALLSTQ